MDDDLVFGVGLIDAVAAEELADVPRVVLNEVARRLVREQLKYYLHVAGAPHTSILLRDEDNRLFINYLAEAWQDHTMPPDYSVLERHRVVVSERLDAFRASPRIWAKYSWVARYHNYVCSHILPGAKNYQINSQLLGLRAARLDQIYRNKPFRPAETKKK